MSKPPFQQLVDSHWRDVARLAYGLAGSDGEDIAQQAWMQALHAYPELRSTKNLRGWLLTITHRCAMDHFRRQKRTPIPVEEFVGNQEPTSPPLDTALPNTPLWEAVQALPDRIRVAICLKYMADLDHNGIATYLDTSPAMSRRLVSDGLKQLRRTHLPDAKQPEGAT